MLLDCEAQGAGVKPLLLLSAHVNKCRKIFVAVLDGF